MSWRYQPVIDGDEHGEFITVIEVYFDETGKLTRWMEESCVPSGENIKELTGDLGRMMVDAMSWVPVRRAELCVGLQFQARVSMDERKDLADFIDDTQASMNRRATPTPQVN